MMHSSYVLNTIPVTAHTVIWSPPPVLILTLSQICLRLSPLLYRVVCFGNQPEMVLDWTEPTVVVPFPLLWTWIWCTILVNKMVRGTLLSGKGGCKFGGSVPSFLKGDQRRPHNDSLDTVMFGCNGWNCGSHFTIMRDISLRTSFKQDRWQNR